MTGRRFTISTDVRISARVPVRMVHSVRVFETGNGSYRYNIVCRPRYRRGTAIPQSNEHRSRKCVSIDLYIDSLIVVLTQAIRCHWIESKSRSRLFVGACAPVSTWLVVGEAKQAKHTNLRLRSHSYRLQQSHTEDGAQSQ